MWTFSADNPQIYLFALLAVGIGSIAAYEDFHYGKIRNKWILAGFAGGLALNLFFIFYMWLTSKDAAVNWSYVNKIFLNAIIAFFCGYLLWKLSAWSAGDAKLFAVLAFLTPIEFYSNGYVDYFPALNLLINIFSVSFVFVLLKIAYGLAVGQPATEGSGDSSAGSQLSDAWKMISERWPNLLLMFALFNAMFLALRYIQPRIHGGPVQMLVNIGFLIFMFGAVKPISAKIETFLDRFPGARMWTLALLPAAFFLTAVTKSAALVGQTAKTIGGFMIFVGVFRKLIEIYLKKVDVYAIKVKDLKPGMIPAEETGEQLKDSGELQTVFMDGFTAEQVEIIKEKLSGEHRLEIYRTVPFAPLALGGLLLTLAIQQSVVHLVVVILK